MCSSSNSKQLSIARSHSASRTVVVASHKNESSTIRFQCVIILTAIAQTAVRSKDITQIFIFLAEMSPQY